jgi:hypothetical protein
VVPGPIPQVNNVTPTNGLATVGTITQATEVPGFATFDVTSEDTNFVATYTINYFVLGPITSSPMPPARSAADVVSIYSDSGYNSIMNIILDQGWCGSPAVTETTVGGNKVLGYKNQACQGIAFESELQDLTGFTHLHVDIFIQGGTNLVGKVFNLKIVPSAGAETEFPIDLGGLSPAPVPGTWYSYDKMIDLTGRPTVDIKQFGVTSNLQNVVWYDNLYFHKNTTLGLEDNELVEFKAYPNPTQDSWTVKTKNEKISTIRILDILGKNVLSLTPNSNEAKINGSGLKSGLYFAQIKTATGISNIKLVKQ